MMRKHNKKRAKTPARLQLRDAEGKIVFDDRIDRLAIEETRVIELSVLYYNDPEPCFIHRGAVLSRVFLELEAACSGEWAELCLMDEELNKNLSMYGARMIRVLQEER